MRVTVQMGMAAIAVALVWTVHAADFGERVPSVKEWESALGGSGGPGSEASGGLISKGPALMGTTAAVRPAGTVRIQFGLGSSEIRGGRSLQTLSNLAQALASDSLRDARFEVVGHTDVTGSYDFNLLLSQRRSRAVVDYLVSLGVDASRLTSRGDGPNSLLPGLAEDSPQHRRVEVRRLAN